VAGLDQAVHAFVAPALILVHRPFCETKGRASFLKKRSKKLLLMVGIDPAGATILSK
jgi:hypothetical protein